MIHPTLNSRRPSAEQLYAAVATLQQFAQTTAGITGRAAGVQLQAWIDEAMQNPNIVGQVEEDAYVLTGVLQALQAFGRTSR